MFPSSRPAYLLLLEDTVNSQHVVKNFVEEHEGNVQLFLIEYFEPGMHIVSQLFLVNRQVVLETRKGSRHFQVLLLEHPLSLFSLSVYLG